MRIGVDIRTLMDRRYSGVSAYTLNLVNELLNQDKKDDFKFFYNSFRNIEANLPKFKGDNIEVVGRHYPNKIFNYCMQKFLHYPQIDQLLKARIFFMPHINFVALSGRIPSVLTIHDLSFLRYPEFFSQRKNIWHRLVNVKKLVKQFTAVVAVSENTKKDIVELCGLPEERIKVVYSGLDVSLPGACLREEARQKYKLPEKFILYLGNVEPRKNLDCLIRAYNQMRAGSPDMGEYKLVIAGAAGWKTKMIFKERNNSPYRDDIIFLGYVDNSHKYCFYELASLFVYPSFYEGFGFPPLEAMAAGCPVIASFASSLPEIAGSAALLINPYDDKQLALAMENVLTDNVFRENLIKKGHKIVENFSWSKTAKEYLRLFASLVD